MAFTDMTGKQVPNVTFHTQQDGKWVDVTTDDLFKGKKVVLFALPGAFTPTCSSMHLPRYNELAEDFKKLGVDDIVCVSVNDTFVMNAWAKDQEAKDIKVIPDGNGEFTEAMGRLIDDSAIGFGKRSWRYSMLVDDGKIVKIFDEPQDSGSDDPYEVSDADTMIRHIDPNWQEKPSVTLFTKAGCPHCAKAKETLNEKGYKYEEIELGKDTNLTAMRAVSGSHTTPQVFIGGKRIGGNEELQQYFADKK